MVTGSKVSFPERKQKALPACPPCWLSFQCLVEVVQVAPTTLSSLNRTYYATVCTENSTGKEPYCGMHTALLLWEEGQKHPSSKVSELPAKLCPSPLTAPQQIHEVLPQHLSPIFCQPLSTNQVSSFWTTCSAGDAKYIGCWEGL